MKVRITLIVLAGVLILTAMVSLIYRATRSIPFEDPDILKQLGGLVAQEATNLSEWSVTETRGGLEFKHNRLNVVVGRELRDYYRNEYGLFGDVRRVEYSDYDIYCTWKIDTSDIEIAYKKLWSAYFRQIMTHTDGK